MKRTTGKTSKRPMANNNKAGGSTIRNIGGCFVWKPSSRFVWDQSSGMKPHEYSSERIAYACEVMTREYKVDPALARSYFIHDPVLVRRRGRKTDAKEFRSEFTYGSVTDGCNCSNDRKTCIWPGDSLAWQDDTCGTTWVGVHGVDSICVVTRSEDLDMRRMRGSLDHWPVLDVFFQFRRSLIVEIEDLVDASTELCQRFQQKIEKPFGVVSVIPDKDNKKRKRNPLKQAPCTEYGEMKAIEFLKEKLNSDIVFTVNETIQTAISAFQHLFQKKFTADEIQVSVMDPKYVADKFSADPTIEDLNTRQITEHIDVINREVYTCHEKEAEPGPEDSSSSISRRLWKRKLQECNLRPCSSGGGGPQTKGSTITK